MVFLFWEQFEAGEGDMFYGQHRVGVRHHLLMLHFGDLDGADEGYEIGRGALTTGIADLFLDPLFEAQLQLYGLGLVHITAIGDIGIRVEAPDPNQVERAFQIMLAINYEALVTPRWQTRKCEPRDARGDRTGGGGGGGGSGASGGSTLTWQTEGEKEEYGDHYRMIHSDFPRMTLVSVGGSGGREAERSIKVIDDSSCVRCWYCHGDDEECKTSKKMKEFQEKLKAEGLASARGTMHSIKLAAELDTAPQHLPPSEEEKIVLKVPIVSLEGRKEEERQKAYTERVKMDGKKVLKKEEGKKVLEKEEGKKVVKKEEGKKVVKKEGKKFVQEAIKSMAEPIAGTVGAVATLQMMTGLSHHAAVEALNQHKRAAERKVAK